MSRREGFVRRAARMLANIVYRDIDIDQPAQPIPDGPVLAVANHFGGLADGVLLVDALPRMPRVVARDVIWRVPGLAQFADLLGGIPVHRAADGATMDNDEMFGSCYRALGDDELVLIFPEGVTQDEPHMAPVRTGAARIALGARASGVAGIRILPVGLHYENKAGFRSRALVNIGSPIDLDQWAAAQPGGVTGADDRAAVRALTALIDERLRLVAPDHTDWPTARSLMTAAEVLLRDVDKGDEELRFGDIALLSSRLGRADTAQGGALRQASLEYRSALADAGSSDAALSRPSGGRGYGWVGDFLLAALLLPYALVGLIAAAVPVLLVTLFSRIPVAPAVRASLVPGVALLAFVFEGIVFAAGLSVNRGWSGAALGLILFPCFVAALFLVHERVVLLWRRWRTHRQPTGAVARELRRRRDDVSRLAWSVL